MKPEVRVWRPVERGFTLIELLVVMLLIALLASLLLPSLAAARNRSRQAVCLSNLRQIGLAVQAYSSDSDGFIPFGPKAPPFTSPADFYPSTGAPTSLISLRNGAPVGLGLLLAQHLGNQSRVLFCPGSDQPVDAQTELARVGSTQAQGSYFYRHAGNTQMFDNPTAPLPTQSLRLHALGVNREGELIRALAIDAQFLAPPDLEAFNVVSRTHHLRKLAQVLFADGHVSAPINHDARFTVDVRDYEQVRSAFERILRVLERADVVP